MTGIDAADLLVGGAPATNVAFTAPATFTFEFPQPPTGTVAAIWIGAHGIKDLATPANNFAGGNWSYILNPNAPEADVIITEFMAANTRTLADEDGDYSDWIEIHNTGAVALNLNGWRLTDNRNNLTKWTFPSTNIAGQAFMIVYASGKDRHTPGRPLHTGFQLGKEGEYLGLVRPDGTIVSEFSPVFPTQVDDVSYGLPTLSSPTAVLALGAGARVHVPINNSLGLDWTSPSFNDSAWLHGTNGVGFETTPAPPSLAGSFSTDIDSLMRNISPSAFIRIPFVVSNAAAFDSMTLRMKYDDGFVAYLNGVEVARRNLPKTIANSVLEFSDTQGANNWQYGYYNKFTDGNTTYEMADFTPFPRAAGAHAADNYWTGTIWDWFAGNPPWTEISANGGHPNGSNNGAEHWVIRRWTAELTGDITVRFSVAKQNLTSGNGVTGRIFHNGVEKFSRTVAFNDGSLITNAVSIPGVTLGDFIDVVLDPTGTDGQPTDAADGSIFTAVIDQEPGLSIEWNTIAGSSRADAAATTFEDIDISGAIPGIQTGTNWLAIHGVNSSAADGDFLMAASVETRTRALQLDQVRYFTSPSPGEDNDGGVDNLGPIISDPQHWPNVPLPNQDILVTAKITPTFAPVGTVTLSYRIMFMGTSVLPMLDDGAHGDGAAGDGTYGAYIPSALSTNGQMRRWFITANDTGSRSTRYPSFLNSTNAPEYLGTIVHVAQTNGLPLLHLFIPDATLTTANNDSVVRYPVSIFYLGRFYDNCGINRHGQSSAGFPKKSYDIDFTAGNNFTWQEGQPTVDDVNLLTTYPDKAHMRNFLGYYGTYQAADSPYHFVEHVRVHHNGVFFGDWHMVENGDTKFLERLGLDPNGALYKMYNTFTDPTDYTISSAEAEKKSRKQEGNADLVALFNGVNTGTAAQKNTFMWDNINVPEVVNTMAARVLTGDVDCCHKNYYFYRDTEGSGEWSALPWDIDLSFGRNWGAAPTYWDDVMYPNNGLFVGNNNSFYGLVFNNGTGASGSVQSQQMYLRRLRTLLDEVMQPTNTPPSELKYEKQIDELASKMIADATLDLKKWGTWGHGSAAIANNDPSYLTVTQAIQQLKDYLPQRRNALIHAKTAGSATLIPPSQPTNVVIRIGAVDFSPGSANQAEEYIQLINTNNISVDITGWKLDGAVQFTFRGGTVLVSNSITYVSPNVKSFRARSAAPRGGQNLLVVGPYDGQLSARGESLTLTDKNGRLVNSNAYVGAPSLPQQYLRITEIMYNPPAPVAGSPYPREDFEYLELKNIGPVAMNLGGVHFTNGIEFAFASVTLNAAERIILAKNPAAFASRYPGVPVAGTYVGSLDNSGESIRLDDAVGEKILDFSYNNTWYPMTDGNGLSLVIVNENALWNTWSDKLSWRPSGFNGTPGAGDAAPLTFAPILVNEVLSHTDLPAVDAIELYNPTANAVDISNWLISDDFTTPKKFRIPAGTIIAAGGYRVFDELSFNQGATAFSFGSDGDDAFVFSGDSAGNPNGYYHGHEFDGAQNGVSFGRYINSISNEHFVAQSANTFNAANALPKVGPIVISEIMYHPPDIATATNLIDNSEDEFVELQNITASPVALFDAAFPTNRWILQDGIDYVFTTNDVIPANGFLVVVSFSPVTNTTALASFRAKYGIAPTVPIVGPYSGQLDNSDEHVELYRPDVPNPDGVPYILVERIHYLDITPWDVIADGFGASLHRILTSSYGNDPTNWIGASPSPGAAFVGGTAPVITQPPASASVFLAGTTNFTAFTTGADVRYQWFFNSNVLAGATSATLTLTDVQYGQAGAYHFVAYNGGGSVVSSPATLIVVTPVFFTVQPASQNVQPGTNVTISAQAVGNGPVRYQWRFQGVNIPNATNSSHSFTGANLEDHHGLFSVVATDDLGSTVSSNAEIYVMIKVVVVNHIQGITNLVGSTVTFSVTATGAPPLWYRWIRGGAAFLTNQSSTLTLTNVLVGGTYRVGITNRASSSGVFSLTQGSVTLALLPDADRDGMEDGWETNYFGTVNTTNNTANALADPDGDGMINRDEYVAGTNPTNGLSVLKIVLSTTNASQLQFVAQSNISYSVQFHTNLASGAWNNVTNINAQSGVRTIEVNNAFGPPAPERYFRIVTPQAP
ncbi:MAG TPA: lamin tail domain-containing protein [Candidatus Limnocylindria bacterium]|nr:lamin tail domain-containing protein [Candidatus Limnocylindria bacterium]